MFVGDLSGIGLLSLLTFLLGLGQQAELFVPLHFQGIGDQTVVGINPHVAQAGLVGLILGPLHLLLPKPIRLGQSGLDFALNL